MKAKSLMLTSLLLLGLLAGCIGNEDDTEEETKEEVIEGCTDPSAANYNELANSDDGSCMILMPEDAIAMVYKHWGMSLIDPVFESTDSRTGFEIMIQKYGNGGSLEMANADAISISSMTVMNDIIPDGYSLTSGREDPDGSVSMLCTCPDDEETGTGGQQVSVNVPTGEDCSSPSAESQLMNACNVDQPGVGTIFVGTYSVIDAALDSPPVVHSQSVYKQGNNEVYKPENMNGMRLADGTYLKDGHDTRINLDRQSDSFIADPSTTAPLAGTELERILSDEICKDGGVVSGESCVWSVPVLDSIFESKGVDGDFGWIGDQLDVFEITYTENADSVLFELHRDEGNHASILISLSKEGDKIMHFVALSNNSDNGDLDSFSEIISFSYLADDNGIIGSAISSEQQDRIPNPGGDNDIDLDPWFYYLCTCGCHPDGQYYMQMSWKTDPNDVWIICNNHCINNYCPDPTPGDPGDYPPQKSWSRGKYSGGAATGDISVDASERVSSTAIAPPSIALELACNPNQGWDGVRTIPLEKISDNNSDCGSFSDIDENMSEYKESGLVFVVSDTQVKNPKIEDISIHFMKEEDGSVTEVHTESLVATEGRAEEGDDQNSAERSVTYTDVDNDGKVSAGDRIEIALGADEFIAFSDSNSEQILPIHGETETSGYLLMNRYPPCEDRNPPGCNEWRTVIDPITGEESQIHYCSAQIEGFDCDGNAVETTEE